MDKRRLVGGMKQTVMLLSVAVLAGIGLVGAKPGGASTGDIFYTTFLWSRAFETFAQIPAELTQGAPSSFVLLYEQNEPGCRVDAGLYDLAAVDDLAHLSVDQYENPVRARATNPETAKSTRAEFGTAPGPHAVADCPSQTSGSGTATWGGNISDDLGVISAATHAASERKPGEQLVITEALTNLAGIRLGKMSVRNLESWIKVEWRPNQEQPVVSYRIVLQGLSDGTTEVASTGGEGIVLSGKSVGGSDLTKQFNAQAEAHKSDLQQIGTFGLHILAPRAYKDTVTRDVQTFRGWTVDAPVLEAFSGFAARSHQVGHRQGVRIGLTRVSGDISQRQ